VAVYEAARRRIATLDSVCDHLSARVVDGERELADARLELTRLHAERERELRILGGVLDELDGVRRQARGQATRIRLRALREAADLGERMDELTRRPVEARERLLGEILEAIARVGGEEEPEPQEPALPALRPVGDMFEGRVEIEVGPFDDFSQLVGFEDAAGGIAATSQISVTRFAQGRATLEMRLAQPVELLKELEERSPFGFAVRDQRADRVVLDVPAPGAEAA
jgi:hypothetical protein